jgi:hypothetical protein
VENAVCTEAFEDARTDAEKAAVERNLTGFGRPPDPRKSHQVIQR